MRRVIFLIIASLQINAAIAADQEICPIQLLSFPSVNYFSKSVSKVVNKVDEVYFNSFEIKDCIPKKNGNNNVKRMKEKLAIDLFAKASQQISTRIFSNDKLEYFTHDNGKVASNSTFISNAKSVSDNSFYYSDFKLSQTSDEICGSATIHSIDEARKMNRSDIYSIHCSTVTDISMSRVEKDTIINVIEKVSMDFLCKGQDKNIFGEDGLHKKASKQTIQNRVTEDATLNDQAI